MQPGTAITECAKTLLSNDLAWLWVVSERFWLEIRLFKATVAHNCHYKTKSHGTTNLTHGKTMLSDCKTKSTHGSTSLIHGKTKLTHGRTPLIHGKTKKTSWSAVVICFSNGMSCNSNTLLARKPPFLVQCSLFRARDVLQLLWFVSRSWFDSRITIGTWEDTAYVIALREPIAVLDSQNLIHFLDYWPSFSRTYRYSELKEMQIRIL